MIDLHIHSCMSDGQYAPSKIVEMAQNQGINLLSLTDHDTVAGVREAMATALIYKVDFIPGIELTAHYQGIEIHILGYYVDIDNRNLLMECDRLEKSRKARIKLLIEALASVSVIISYDQVAFFAKGSTVTKLHLAQALVKSGYAKCIASAFKQYLNQAARALPNSWLPVSDAIELIINAGGVPVLAHPGLIPLESTAFDIFFSSIVDYGIKGVECYYSKHNSCVTDYFVELVHQYDLIATYGSDYHGEAIDSTVKLGDIGYKPDASYDYSIKSRLLGKSGRS